MKKLYLCLTFVFFASNINSYFVTFDNTFTIKSKRQFTNVTKEKLESIPDEYLLAMVAIHECINLCPQDTKFIQEATWNRVKVNWGNHGTKLYQQLSSTEFNGLIDKNFYFNPDNPKHLFALELAKRVVSGEREVKHKLLLGWLTDYDDPTHYDKAMKTFIATPTWHKFWTL